MDHPRKTIKVTAAVLEHHGKIFIAQRKPTDHLAHKWEFPGGKIENNESPEQCLKREMQEEFHINVSIGDYIESNIYHYDHISIELMVFRTYWVNGEIDLQDHADYQWVRVNHLGNYDFAPADIPFFEKLSNGEIVI